MTTIDALKVTDVYEQETTKLADFLAGLQESDWIRPTPAKGWTVTDQVAHLAFVYNLAAQACHAPDEFKAGLQQVAEVGFEAAVKQGLTEYGAGSAQDVLGRFKFASHMAATGLRSTTAQRVPWLVNPLPPSVLAMAGMLETFAHGQDIYDTLDTRVERGDELEYLVHFIARTRDFGYLSHDMTPPVQEFLFQITLPSGRTVEVGPADSSDVVRGPAEDLALLASRRRHRDDLDVVADGQDAKVWLTIAQAYRGPAGPGRAPGQFNWPRPTAHDL